MITLFDITFSQALLYLMLAALLVIVFTGIGYACGIQAERRKRIKRNTKTVEFTNVKR